jgi:hypothetical protein
VSQDKQEKTEREEGIKEFHDFWFSLMEKAFDKSPFDALCTLLRPRAMHDAGWDVLDESEATFADFNWMLSKAEKEKGQSCARRLALHYYCFIIEMSPIHEMILNLLRCISGQQYLPFPFAHLYRKKKKNDPWSVIPPSLPGKTREITTLAESLGEKELIKHLKFVFDEGLRNAIAHSDYTLTESEFRTMGGSLARVIPLKDLDYRIRFCFVFVSGLLKAYNNMKYALGKCKRFHKWDNFEVLELLKNENGVYGFHVHFSNGSKSTFSRTRQGVTQINMILRNGVGFMVGPIWKLERVWKVNGVPVTDWDKLNEAAESHA